MSATTLQRVKRRVAFFSGEVTAPIALAKVCRLSNISIGPATQAKAERDFTVNGIVWFEGGLGSTRARLFTHSWLERSCRGFLRTGPLPRKLATCSLGKRSQRCIAAFAVARSFRGLAWNAIFARNEVLCICQSASEVRSRAESSGSAGLLMI